MDASSVYDWNEECVPTGRGQEDRGKKKWEGSARGVQGCALSESNLITNWPFGTHSIFTQLIKSYHVDDRTGLPTDDLQCPKFRPERSSREEKRGKVVVGCGWGGDQNCNETARGVPVPFSLSHFTMYFHEIFRHARVKFRSATGVAANFLAPPKTEAREGVRESASERASEA